MDAVSLRRACRGERVADEHNTIAPVTAGGRQADLPQLDRAVDGEVAAMSGNLRHQLQQHLLWVCAKPLGPRIWQVSERNLNAHS
ncbi:hypothetical protein [Mesorhizobium sp. LNHC209A00]|uniref:hypothetical protein n=1 Tax=Mesorhizobium TaxID=68287 RepID=UPI0012EBC1C2|nr:hypothetical protein [Mesorhizobium sp. LNHC209A00]